MGWKFTDILFSMTGSLPTMGRKLADIPSSGFGSLPTKKLDINSTYHGIDFNLTQLKVRL